jgi:hypothetical protein
MKITLSASELLLSSGVGARRHAANLLAGRPDRHGAPQSWDVHIEGACGECAAAKALNVYWPASVDFRERQAGDLPGGVEVRTTSHAGGSLILHEQDPGDRRYVLVVGRAPVFDVVGFIVGSEGRQAKWWKDPSNAGRWAYFAPSGALYRMEDWSTIRPDRTVDLRERVEATPAIRRLVAAIDGQVEGVERVRIEAPSTPE